ncbi:SOS response-associated peptidase [Sporolactobacillus shoreicorticis]|uniref:Abasic site processing protein n=1 Tax=Sporolactobacillus shoreicorticis TaxID=1923877 RepID=A0ABW5RZZ0_9BACL|nr:SOS response-associated peptidase [Sporolactobacillus shoreicorticis]MCO7127927.1 SOS response-associated peptidase [Sporolactobacillus shoreicorticis]
MCGRFTLIAPYEYIVHRFQIQHAAGNEDYKANYNVAPGQKILSVVRGSKGNRMGYLQWGLIPSWAKDKKIGYKLINARAESLLQKPSFRDPFRRRRCLIVADSFYEWDHRDVKQKIPYRFTMKSGELFAIAGLWDSWTTKDHQVIYSCTIITTEANELMEPIHDRMPVILTQSDEAKWLDPATETKELMRMLKPFDPEQMQFYEVTQDVNAVRNNAPYLIKKM